MTRFALVLSSAFAVTPAFAQDDDLELPIPAAKPGPSSSPDTNPTSDAAPGSSASTPSGTAATPSPAASGPTAADAAAANSNATASTATASTAPSGSPATLSPETTPSGTRSDAGASAAVTKTASANAQTGATSSNVAAAVPAARGESGADSKDPSPAAASAADGRACSTEALSTWTFASRSRKGFVTNPYSRGLACGQQVSGFVQGQLQFNQISEDQLQASGAPLNRDQFVLRATRVRLDAGYSYAGYSFELDANTVRGPRVGIRRAEGLLFYRNPQPGSAPLVALSVGVSDVPFGYELVESTPSRWFTERSVASEALFPTQTDVNARLFGAWRFLRYALALGNGQPVNDSSFASDPNARKEVAARFGADASAGDVLAISGGTSFTFGKGFHAGSAGTKDSVAWRDDNSDGLATPNEIVGAPGTAPTASENFERWALGVDLQLQLRTAIGLSSLALEGYLGLNHDRGLFVSDPVETGRDQRQSGLVASLTQQVFEHGVVGIRFANYDPDADFSEGRRGNFVPRSQGVTTISPLVGLAWPEPARLILQYDWVRDEFARDSIGVPKDAKNNQFTARLQVTL